MQNITTLANEAINSTIEKLHKHNENIQIRLMADIDGELTRLAELNGGVFANVDRLFRLHAPFDGYVVNVFGSDRTYLKGEFIANPYVSETKKNLISSISDSEFKKYREKMLVSKEIAEIVSEELYDNGVLNVSYGKSWINDNREICYLYAQGPKFLVQHFIKQLNSIETSKRNTEPTGNAVLGRVPVEGVVLGLYCSYDEVYKMYNQKARILLNNDSTCYGNIAKDAIGKINVGDKVSFVATFKGSENSYHSFFSRAVSFKKIDDIEEVLINA